MDFTHFNENGMARMVDVSEKNETQRKATARGYIKMAESTIESIKERKLKKGDVLSVAQVGGICGYPRKSTKRDAWYKKPYYSGICQR